MKFFKPIVAALMVVAVTGAAQAQQEPGLTDKTIKVGVFGPLSGNSMAYGFDVINAAKMYYDKVNKEGGVHGRKIELVVEDDGAGISEEDRDRLFSRGVRLDSSKPGTGLGLAIVRDVAEIYGGTISLEESEDMGGLLARLRLPLAP